MKVVRVSHVIDSFRNKFERVQDELVYELLTTNSANVNKYT